MDTHRGVANVNFDTANSASPSFKPSQVYACLKDVPINITAAADLIDYLEVNLQFQSTLAYLKSPPSSYPRPAVDLLGGLSSIKENVQAGRYDGEYGFEYDIWSLIAKAFDGHLSVLPFLIGSFAYGPRVVLASVSMDGTEAPKVYFKCK